MTTSKEKINELQALPVEVQLKVKAILKAYYHVNVYFYNGDYHVSPNNCIMASYPDDHKYINEFRQDELYTLNEQIENYRNEFHAEPFHLVQELKRRTGETLNKYTVTLKSRNANLTQSEETFVLYDDAFKRFEFLNEVYKGSKYQAFLIDYQNGKMLIKGE